MSGGYLVLAPAFLVFLRHYVTIQGQLQLVVLTKPLRKELARLISMMTSTFEREGEFDDEIAGLCLQEFFSESGSWPSFLRLSVLASPPDTIAERLLVLGKLLTWMRAPTKGREIILREHIGELLQGHPTLRTILARSDEASSEWDALILLRDALASDLQIISLAVFDRLESIVFPHKALVDSCTRAGDSAAVIVTKILAFNTEVEEVKDASGVAGAISASTTSEVATLFANTFPKVAAQKVMRLLQDPEIVATLKCMAVLAADKADPARHLAILALAMACDPDDNKAVPTLLRHIAWTGTAIANFSSPGISALLAARRSFSEYVVLFTAFGKDMFKEVRANSEHALAILKYFKAKPPLELRDLLINESWASLDFYNRVIEVVLATRGERAVQEAASEEHPYFAADRITANAKYMPSLLQALGFNPREVNNFAATKLVVDGLLEDVRALKMREHQGNALNTLHDFFTAYLAAGGQALANAVNSADLEEDFPTMMLEEDTTALCTLEALKNDLASNRIQFRFADAPEAGLSAKRQKVTETPASVKEGPQGASVDTQYSRLQHVANLVSAGKLVSTATHVGNSQDVYAKKTLAKALGVGVLDKCWEVLLAPAKKGSHKCCLRGHSENCSHHTGREILLPMMKSMQRAPKKDYALK
jgi:hypothetical protein